MNKNSPNGFFLYKSNLLEKLCDKAIEILNSSSEENPLKKVSVIVQTDGLGKWLALQIAEKNGICANIEFLSPEQYINKVSKDVLKIDNGKSIYESMHLKWIIYDILGSDLMKKAAFKSMNNYILGDPVRRYLISGKCADLFDQYAVFRPKMIESWKKGANFYKSDKDEKWQKELFIEIGSRFPDEKDRVDFHKLFTAKCDDLSNSGTHISGDLLLFGISSMSEYHLYLFKALSGIMPVHFLSLNPSGNEWGYIVSTKKSEKSKILGKDELYYESGNRFLADLGMSGRDFFKMMTDSEIEDFDLFSELEKPKTMLEKVQKEVFDINELEKFELDGSIKISGCWGKMRELEVLKDNLFDIFSNNPSIQPSDVIVMSPDIEEYAPYIEAVFSAGENERSIPFSIADRSAGKEGPVVSTFLKILKLNGSLFKKSEVLSVFENEAIYKKFKLEKKDLKNIRTAVEESGIKWGIDKRFRESRNFPPFEQNSWKFGIERMILGYSMPGKGIDSFGGVLPYDEIEGSSARTIAKFISFTDTLFRIVNSYNMDKTVADWAARFNDLIDALFDENIDTAREIRYLRQIADNLKESSVNSGFLAPVPLKVVQIFIEESVQNSGFRRGFLNGSVTFCSLKPMRSIPFKVISMIGMNDEVFPREPSKSGFDLIKKYPLANDRNPKFSDKYFFLESMLSAGSFLLISYNARSVRDSSHNLCSSPVKMLSDHLNFKTGKFKEAIYPLQPFSKKYFTADSPLFTYSGKDFEAHNAFAGRDIEYKANIQKAVDKPQLGNETTLELELDDFISFFLNPPKYFLRKRLGILLPYFEKPDEDSEVFSIDPLTGYGFKNELVNMTGKGQGVADFKKKMKGEGKAPHGPAGQVLLAGALSEMDQYLSKIQRYKSGSDSEEISFEYVSKFPGQTLKVQGRLDAVFSNGQLFFRPSKKANPKDKIKCWISHLFMNAAGRKIPTYFIGMEKDLDISPVENPEIVLDKLAAIYLKGISTPLPVNPFIAETMNLGLKFGKNKNDAFLQMLDKKKNPWGGSEDDPAFKFVAEITQFYSVFSETVDLVAKVSSEIFSEFERHKQES